MGLPYRDHTREEKKYKPIASIFYESNRNFVSASGSGMWFSLIQNCDFCCGISTLQTGINGAYQSFLSCLTHKAFLRAKHPCPGYLLTSIHMSLPFYTYVSTILHLARAQHGSTTPRHCRVGLS